MRINFCTLCGGGVWLLCLLLTVTNATAAISDDNSLHSVFDGCTNGHSKLGIHHVIVSQSGDTNLSCLTGNHPCSSLQFVLDNVMNCTNITLTYNQTLKRPNWFTEHIFGLAIIGNTSEPDTMVHIECEEGTNAGIGFNNSRDIMIRNINWSYCELVHTTSDAHENASSAIFFGGGANIFIVDCVFYHSNGTGLSLFNVGGHVTISNTIFEKNHPWDTREKLHCGQVPPDTDSSPVSAGQKGGGLYIEHDCTDFNNTNSSLATSYLVQNSLFRFNINRHLKKMNRQEYSTAGKGGGMAVILIGHCHGYNVTVESCAFINNTAIWGGAFIVEGFGDNGQNSIFINNTVIANSTACKSGGGVHVGMETTSSESHKGQGVDVCIYSTYFDSNLALHGGGAYLHSNTHRNGKLEFVNCTWYKNAANYSGYGSAIALSTQNRTNTIAEFKGCNFTSNYHIVSWSRKFDISSQGAVYTFKVPLNFSRGPLEFQGHGTYFFRNIGSALSAHATTVTMKDFIHFDSNYGIFGGGICLVEKAYIVLNDTVLSFVENFALVHGGAIYSRLPTSNDKTLPCIFDYNLVDGPPSMVIFANNTVRQRYESIYINNPIGCGNSSWLNNSKVFRYDDDIGSESIITVPSNIKFHDPKNSSILNDTIEIMVGENFTIYPTVYDEFGHETQTIANVELAVGDSFSAPYDDATYHLIGPDTILMGNHTNDTHYYITGLSPSMVTSPPNLTIVFIVNHEVGSFNAHLYVTLVECKLGFVYDNDTQRCVCDQDDQLNIKCPEPGQACVRYGYWYGPIPDFETPVIHPCKSRYCQYKDGRCPERMTSCGLNYCSLTETSDDICRTGRGGVLCGDCQANYSFNYEGYECSPKDTCKAGNTVLLLLGVIGYWLIFILGLLLLLRLSLRIGSGYVYGVMYYFSVITQTIDDQWPSDILRVIVGMCIAITQMCPKVLSQINICFASSMDSIMHEFFHYTTPLFISVVLLTTIGLAWYCRLPKVISPAEHSPIHAICVLILLAYSSITYTNFKILSGIQFNGSSAIYSEIQPSVKYWDSTRHLPYALIAILLEACIVLPFCFLLLFAPCLSSRVNFVKLKIKPILDEFQACYRDDCRWFAGYYLLSRQLVYLMKIVPPQITALYLVQYLNIFILIGHASLQPYQDKWLNTIDTLLLMDLVMLSLMHGPTDHYFELANIPTASIIKKISSYILILVPCFYLLAVLVGLVVKRSGICLKLKTCCIRRRQASRSVVGLSSQPSTSVVEVSDGGMVSKSDSFGSSFLHDPGEREPLLAYQDNSKFHEEMKRKEERERHLTSYTEISTSPVASRTSLISFPPSSKKARTN